MIGSDGRRYRDLYTYSCSREIVVVAVVAVVAFAAARMSPAETSWFLPNFGCDLEWTKLEKLKKHPKRLIGKHSEIEKTDEWEMNHQRER